jgi:hypothetical protein
MPVHVDEMTTEVDAFDGDLPLSREQLERLVQMVSEQIEQKQRDRDYQQQSSQIRTGSITR